MEPSENNSWEIARTEYEKALEFFRHFGTLRRQDMAFVTTVQGVALTIIGQKLSNLDFPSLLLSLIAFFVLLLGLNSERRLSAYMAGDIQRAREIESRYGMSLLSDAYDHVKSKRMLFSNVRVFPVFYGLFIVAWVCIWTANLVF